MHNQVEPLWGRDDIADVAGILYAREARPGALRIERTGRWVAAGADSRFMRKAAQQSSRTVRGSSREESSLIWKGGAGREGSFPIGKGSFPKRKGRGRREPAVAAYAGRGAKETLVSLAVALAVPVPVAAGLAASLFNTANTQWYDRLRKPSWNPANWLFLAAWSVLYAVMGLASWLVWLDGGWDAHILALALYVLQLVLNLLWPAIFFGAKRLSLALLDITALWLVVVACIRAFEEINPLAAQLLYPYLAWVTFVVALNYMYWKLNSPPPRSSNGDDQFIHNPA